MKISRRALLRSSVVFSSLPMWISELRGAPSLRVRSFELIPVRASDRTVWLMVRLRTDQGLTGLGEASDAFGFANTTKQDAMQMESTLRTFFGFVEGKSPLEVEAYRQKAEPVAAAGGLVQATAYSAIEQALWDLAGQALGVPVYDLFGGKVRDTLPVYANINRATQPRTPDGFAATARRAVAEGFGAVKGAVFDGFPKPGSPAAEIQKAIDLGIASVAAMRDAIGPQRELMVDCHSFFDVPLAQGVARRLEQYNLAWYEEPVAPERTDETVEIHRSIRQPMAGGELLFGMKGFAPLCRRQAVNVIMPDVKHCGGLLEMTRIAAMAKQEGVAVAPHNPSGPVSTAANVQICAGMPNFRLLELQWGEASWRSDIVIPQERFAGGTIEVPARPGLGIQLNDKVARAHPI
ncbi:MAG TPA: mandelate racemase/muconate lactonizing enzyme family protein [Bryobacteraceae bacterium]|jgi:galactonate dehydratase